MNPLREQNVKDTLPYHKPMKSQALQGDIMHFTKKHLSLSWQNLLKLFCQPYSGNDFLAVRERIAPWPVGLSFSGLHIFCLLLVCVGAILSSPAVAQAATFSPDPLVTIASDTTNTYGPCSLTFRRGIGTSHETKQKVPCPANTFLHYQTVKRSQAIAQHEYYVPLPPANASSIEQQKWNKQIIQLDEIKHQGMHQAIANVIPASSCGGTEQSISAEYDPYIELALELTVYYFKLSNCSIAFDSAVVYTIYDGNGAASDIWQYDAYASSTFNATCAGTPPAGYSVAHSISSSAYPSGYGYAFWFSSAGTWQCAFHIGGQYEGYLYPIN